MSGLEEMEKENLSGEQLKNAGIKLEEVLKKNGIKIRHGIVVNVVSLLDHLLNLFLIIIKIIIFLLIIYVSYMIVY